MGGMRQLAGRLGYLLDACSFRAPHQGDVFVNAALALVGCRSFDSLGCSSHGWFSLLGATSRRPYHPRPRSVSESGPAPRPIGYDAMRTPMLGLRLKPSGFREQER